MILKSGSQGQQVALLQEKLGIPSDGIFGSDTETALKAWQKGKGLVADGIAGDKTLSLMGIVTTPASPLDFTVNYTTLQNVIPDAVFMQLGDTIQKFNITTNLRLCHFLAQCAHESGGFKTVFENLNYSAQGLRTTFKKYFPDNLAESYARNPKKIGSRVYANRMGNGDEASGDGFRYRGRGYIQLTGKSNYTSFAKYIGEDVVENPDIVATKYPLSSAAFFFDSRKIWKVCDKGWGDDVVEDVTLIVNGGLNGITDRKEYFHKYSKYLLPMIA